MLIFACETADLSKFYGGQSSAPGCLRMSNFETDRLVDFSGHIIVSTSTGWINDVETISIRHRVVRQCFISKNYEGPRLRTK